MGVKVNAPGVAQAKGFIADGKINEGAWSVSAEDGDKLLGPNGDDWPNFAKYHLAEHTDQPEKTKARYGYPYGKAGEAYRRGVAAAKSRAAQQKDTEIEARASELLDLMDKKKAAPKKSIGIEEIRAKPDLLEGKFDRPSLHEPPRTVPMPFSSH